MAVMQSGNLKTLPRQIADGMVAKAQSGSTVAALSGAEPMRFGNVDIVTFDQRPRAEFVEEGAEKGHTTATMGMVTAKPHKAQVTMRFSDEVRWADEDYHLGLLSELANAGAKALSRALDLGLYHRINPLTGQPISSWDNYLTKTSNVVEVADKPDIEIETAAGLVVGAEWPVTGIAMDPKFAWTLARARYQDGKRKYPDLGLGVSPTVFEGVPTSVGNTVSGMPEAEDTKVRAIVGNFQGGIRWGIQQSIPVEMIEHGDPDGQGDLKRKNQIALRLEIVYAWYVFEDQFAVLKDNS